MSTVDFPDLKSVAELGPEEHIASFYEKLGWERGTELNPTSITINEQRWLEICDGYNKLPGPGIGGYVWMNIGPSASKGVPYHKIEIDPDAFNRDWSKLSPAEEGTLDRAIRENFTVEGNTVHLEADYSDSNEFLLQAACDARTLGPEGYMEILHGMIDEAWQDGIDLAVDEMVERSGIALPGSELFGAAHDHVIDNYVIEPPYSHYLDQEMRVNIMLGTKEERNLDFGSIRAMCDGLNEPGYLNADDLDNGLTWLVKQQGHTLDELKGAVANYEKWGFDAAEITHGTFLASVAEEMANFPNHMGTVTALANLSMSDLGKTLDENDVLTIPKDATIGIFAPWVGGGSGLDIQLERDLDITSDVRFDVQIEGARNAEYTVQDVYGLVDEAWKEPAAIKFSEARPLDELMAKAKERAAERNLGHLAKERKPPELEL